jgi:hypothetical protein
MRLIFDNFLKLGIQNLGEQIFEMIIKVFLYQISALEVIRRQMIKKSDAQVGRVKSFHILQTIRKGPSNFKLCMKRPLKFSNF